MKFGSIDNPGDQNLSLPEDHPETKSVLSDYGNTDIPNVYVGCAKWNKKDLKNFYPKGVSDELTYYGQNFNAVELNATFYNTFDEEQVTTWYNKVPDNFKFFPKVNRYISHLKWLNGIEEATDNFYDSIVHFREKLGTVFLQLRGNFKPKYMNRVSGFVEHWPKGVPLAIEFRHPDWFADPGATNELYALLEEHNIANLITDTAGRRDLLHMRLTNNEAFVRYVGANHESDVSRLDEWVERLADWNQQGLDNIHFFVHQNKERKSPELAAYFINKLNKKLGTALKSPNIGGNEGDQAKLF